MQAIYNTRELMFFGKLLQVHRDLNKDFQKLNLKKCEGMGFTAEMLLKLKDAGMISFDEKAALKTQDASGYDFPDVPEPYFAIDPDWKKISSLLKEYALTNQSGFSDGWPHYTYIKQKNGIIEYLKAKQGEGLTLTDIWLNESLIWRKDEYPKLRFFDTILGMEQEGLLTIHDLYAPRLRFGGIAIDERLEIKVTATKKLLGGLSGEPQKVVGHLLKSIKLSGNIFAYIDDLGQSGQMNFSNKKNHHRLEIFEMLWRERREIKKSGKISLQGDFISRYNLKQKSGSKTPESTEKIISRINEDFKEKDIAVMIAKRGGKNSPEFRLEIKMV